MDEILELSGTVIDDVLVLENAVVYDGLVEIVPNEVSESMYKQRMLDYYPQVVKNILEFRAIVDSEYPEIEKLHNSVDSVINDAWILTMSEERIIQWEKILGIKPIPGSTVDDRRDTIIARIRGQGKLNTALINSIVNTFTGGTANSYVKDSCLYVEILPPPDNKQYQFLNVEQELKNKIPAHLGLNVKRQYSTWGEIKNKFASWKDVKESFPDWGEVKIYISYTS